MHEGEVQEQAETQPASTHADPLGVGETDAHETGSVIRNVHPAFVHFPIALLLMAALAELAAMRRPGGRLRPAAEVMAAIGGVSATVAALFGWIHTGLWFGGESTMVWHRWIGTALALIGPLIALIALRAPEKRTAFRMLLFTAALLLIVQGWLGAELSRGAGHLFAV